MSEPMQERPIPASVPSLDEVRGWLETLSTWGRWGPDDDRGTLNYIGEEERRAAAHLATAGATVSLTLPISHRRESHSSVGPGEDGAPHPAWARPQRFVIDSGHGATTATKRVVRYDAFLLAPHGPHVTHLDAPTHTELDGTHYNGQPVGADGPRGSIMAASDGIVGRGVLLDVPAATDREWLDDGEAIHPPDLEAAERLEGVGVGRGDVLLVRTGYRRRLPGGPSSRHAPRPGLHASCLPWLAERQISVIGSDVAVDVIPHGYEDLGLPIHTVGMWAMGLWLIDNCALELLAAECARRSRYEFQIAVAPLALQDGTGSPVNPIAVF